MSTTLRKQKSLLQIINKNAFSKDIKKITETNKNEKIVNFTVSTNTYLAKTFDLHIEPQPDKTNFQKQMQTYTQQFSMSLPNVLET